MSTIEKTITIPDSVLKSENMTYSNTNSGLNATNAQEAIDELTGIYKTTDTTLDGSKAGGYKLVSMSGASEQKTTTGAQLLNPSVSVLGSLTELTKSEDGYTLTASGTASWAQVTLHEIAVTGGETIYISAEQITDSTSNKGSVVLQAHNGTSIVADATLTSTKSTLVIPDDCTILRVVLVANASSTEIETANTITVKGLLVTRDANATWEPYTGGIPSPNPDYPQSINNTFDCVEMKNGGYLSTTGAYDAVIANHICTKNYIPCSSGDVVKILNDNVDQVILGYYSDGTYSTYTYLSGTLGEYSFTIPSGITSFTVTMRNQNGLTPDTVGKITLTINDKYVVQVKTNGTQLANLPDVDTTTWYGITWSCKNGVVTAKGTATANSSTQTIGIYYDMPIVAGTYFISGNSGHAWVYVQIKHSDGSMKYPTNTSFTLDGTETQAKVFIQVNIGNTVDTICYPMLNKGTEPLPFEPYQESVATVLLNEPLRDGDVLTRTEVVRNRGGVVLNGNENWEYSSGAIENSEFFRCIGILSGGNSECLSIISSHFPKKNVMATNTLEGINNYLADVYIRTSEFTDLESFTTWLASNPVTVEYKLAEPITEELDTDSKIALNSLETFDGVTHVTVDSRVQPGEIVGEYGTSVVGAYTLKALLNSETALVKLSDITSTTEAATVSDTTEEETEETETTE